MVVMDLDLIAIMIMVVVTMAAAVFLTVIALALTGAGTIIVAVAVPIPYVNAARSDAHRDFRLSGRSGHKRKGDGRQGEKDNMFHTRSIG